MFNHIAPRYDFLNHFLSLGIDKIWRRRVVSQIADAQYGTMLDVATGTGDLAIAAAKRSPELSVKGVDIAVSMLKKAMQKIEKNGLANRVEVAEGDAENLKFENHTFDVVTAAFGVRNFENVHKGLLEMYRVLKPQGDIIILEFSKPRKGFFAMVYRLYFKIFLPLMGKMVSGNNRAYTYLPESVQAFAERDEFLQLLKNAGFVHCKYEPLTFGVACIYVGQKEP